MLKYSEKTGKKLIHNFINIIYILDVKHILTNIIFGDYDEKF